MHKALFLMHDQVTSSGMIGPGHVGTYPPMKVGPRSCQPRSFPTTCSEAALSRACFVVMPGHGVGPVRKPATTGGEEANLGVKRPIA